ncbi:penicillin-binding protein 2 [Microbispora rosea subsp. aerata]|nr:penicillin-binding protein 2 [Microbispora rosea]GGO07922.1 penicillin-binding protein 2 [Microbispora rosea subsp. aerata]GIH53298.1 penicillin-binding protein 2 [Microbispora rosea subsp. aerata]GLJ83788.1 penicillin-binding protein 2 [Microbispora rosea subsp. aerata]
MRRPTRSRLLVVHLLVAALFLVLLGRLWQVQILDGDRYARMAADNHTRRTVIPAVRGEIVDARGRPLARNRAAVRVTVDRAALDRLPDRGRAVLGRLADLLGRPREEIAGRLRVCGPGVDEPCRDGVPYEPVPVADGVSERVALRLMERRHELPGVRVEPRPVREYPRGTLAAHLLGYLAPGSSGAGRGGAEATGRDGLEAHYEADLSGRAGSREIVVDSGGRAVRTVREQAPVPGATLVTSIDARVQAVVEKALKKAAGRAAGRGGAAGTGAAVVMDARTGRVVALAGYPAYDPSVWTGGIREADYKRLTSPAHGLPLISRAVQGQWPPASTWKIVSTAAAARAGYPLDGRYDCSGSYRIGDRSFRNFGGRNLGGMDLHRALVVSCDTIFYRFAYRMWLKDEDARRPADPMQRMARAFGFGVRTGVDLPGEAAGRVPDRTWKRTTWEDTRKRMCADARTGYPSVARTDPRRAAYLKAIAKENCRHGYLWTAGDAANFSIGQGDVLVTPLQLARAYAALANGGTLFSPRVGRAVVGRDGRVLREITPPVTGRLPVPGKTLAYIRRALADVPRSGTAAPAFAGFPLDKVPVAGKTGTAEAYGAADTSWFASFAPADDPRLVVVVVVSEGGAGAEAAAPAAREIWSGIYGLEGKRAALPGGKPPAGLPKTAGYQVSRDQEGFPRPRTTGRLRS